MLKKLLAVLVQSEQSKQRELMRAAVVRNNRIAEILENMITSGRYNGHYMCIDLRLELHQGRLNFHEFLMTKQCIDAALGDHGTLMGYLRNYYHDDTFITDAFQCFETIDQFERRIICSNWYWGFIRKLRHQAKIIEQNI
jgi:hypothetical protein